MVKTIVCAALLLSLFSLFPKRGLSSEDQGAETVSGQDIIHRYCRDAIPIKDPEFNSYSLPGMRDEEILAAWRAGGEQKRVVDADLAAVLLRYERFSRTSGQITRLFPFGSDVGRLFASRYAWRCRNLGGDEILMSSVADWIKTQGLQFFDSPLLRAEIELFDANGKNAMK